MKRRENSMAGDLMKEIQEQDLMVPVGGQQNGGDEQQGVVSAITAITALTAWSHDKITRKFGCGEVLTFSAECNGGKAC